MRCGRLALGLSLLLGGGTARGGDEAIPFRVGITHLADSPGELEMARLLQGIAASSERCFSRRISLLLARGTYAQVYGWMKRGLVDGAVVSGLVGSQLLTLSDSDGALPFSPGLVFEPRIPGEARLRYRDPSGAPGSAGSAYDAWLEQLAAAARSPGSPSPAGPEVHFVDHLSTTGFLLPLLHAAEFLNKRPEALTTVQEEDFWRRLLDSAHFTFFQERGDAEGEGPTPGRALLEFGAAGSSRADWEPLRLHVPVALPDDVLVIANSFFDRLVKTGPELGWPCAAAGLNAGGASATPSYRGVRTASRKELDPVYAELRQRIGKDLGSEPHLGARLRDWLADNRHDYTLDSALRMLQVDASLTGIDRLALVLPGGGVKATYQAVFLDNLYRGKRLRNEGFEPSSPGMTVRTVVGTSGGAMTGLFVATKKNAAQDLLPLWFADGKARIGPADVLPSLGILRSFGMLLCLAIVWAALSVRFLFRDLPPAAGAPPQGRRLLAVTLTSGVIVLGPVLIALLSTISADLVARLQGRPVDLTNAYADSADFPWQVGVLQLLNLALCHFCISRPSGLRQRELRARRLGPKRYALRWADLGVFALHVLLALAAIALVAYVLSKTQHRVTRTWFLYAYTLSVTLFCVDAVYQPLRDYWAADRRQFLGQLALTVLFVTLLAGLTFVPAIAGVAIETEGLYWGALCLLAAAAGLLLAVPELTRVRALSWFLAERHVYLARPWRRISSFVLLGALGFLFWNLTLAPSLFNRENARRTLRRQFDGWRGPAQPAGDTVQLSTEFVVTATAVGSVTLPAVSGGEALTKGDGDLYVLYSFPSRNDAAATQPLPGRWVSGICKVDPLLDVVFSSGAAFPVFAPFVVTRAGFESVLMDGGFTHNVPIEAAQERGARQVLVLHSSPKAPLNDTPLRSGGGTSPVFWSRIIGPFFRRLPTIPGLLFNRAQAVDARAQRDLLVAEVIPRDDPARSFPNLASFSTANISNLQKWANEDRDRSVVWVESWGLPVFSILEEDRGTKRREDLLRR